MFQFSIDAAILQNEEDIRREISLGKGFEKGPNGRAAARGIEGPKLDVSGVMGHGDFIEPKIRLAGFLFGK
ncbi:MAG: hypothetical protein IH898_08065, partial [Planctomycetes bacterium]|nr:hypothetical protein [Planctomycetota bacterium]